MFRTGRPGAKLPCLILLRLFVSRALPSMETICDPHRKKFESAVIRGLCAHIFQLAFIANFAFSADPGPKIHNPDCCKVAGVEPQVNKITAMPGACFDVRLHRDRSTTHLGLDQFPLSEHRRSWYHHSLGPKLFSRPP